MAKIFFIQKAPSRHPRSTTLNQLTFNYFSLITISKFTSGIKVVIFFAYSAAILLVVASDVLFFQNDSFFPWAWLVSSHLLCCFFLQSEWYVQDRAVTISAIRIGKDELLLFVHSRISFTCKFVFIMLSVRKGNY